MKEFINKYGDKITHSYFYIGFIALMAFIGWAIGNVTFAYVSMGILALLTPFLTKDVKTLIPFIPLGFTCFKEFFYFDSIPIALIVALAMLFISIVVFVVRNIIDKSVKFRLSTISKSLGLIAIISFLAYLVRAIFYNYPAFDSYQEAYNINYGLLYAAIFIILFGVSLFFSCFNNDDNYEIFEKTFYVFGIYMLMQLVLGLITSGPYDDMYFYIGWCDKNASAIAIEFVLPFIAYIYSKNYKRIDCLIILFSLIAFVLMSNSRGGQITCALMSLLLLFIIVKPLKSKWKWYGIILGASAIVALAGITAIPAIRESVFRLFEKGFDLTGRDKFWGQITDYVIKQPAHLLFGGSGAYLFEIFPHFCLDWGYECIDSTGLLLCHNTVMTALAATGILGVIAVCLFHVEAVGSIIKRTGEYKYVFITLIFYSVVHGLIDNTFYNVVFLVPFVIIMSCYEKEFKELF